MPDADDALLHELDITLSGVDDQLSPLAWSRTDDWPLARARSHIRAAREHIAFAREMPRDLTLDEMNAQFDAELDALEDADDGTTT